MHRPAEDLVRRSRFHEAAAIHDGDAVGENLHHGEIMADEEEGEPLAVAQIHQQIEHLRLDEEIESGDGLIGDDEPRPADEGARDGDALTLPAGELVGQAIGIAGGEADLAQDLGHPRPARGAARGLGIEMERLGDDACHGLARIEGAIGILEHHLESAPKPGQAMGGLGEKTLAREDHLAGGGTIERHDQPRQGRFAAAALADDAEGRAFLDRETDDRRRPSERMRTALAEMAREVARLEDAALTAAAPPGCSGPHAGRQLAPGGLDRPAGGHDHGAAIGEAAAGRETSRRRHAAGNAGQAAGAAVASVRTGKPRGGRACSRPRV